MAFQVYNLIMKYVPYTAQLARGPANLGTDGISYISPFLSDRRLLHKVTTTIAYALFASIKQSSDGNEQLRKSMVTFKGCFTTIILLVAMCFE